jgi:hypothetical protein
LKGFEEQIGMAQLGMPEGRYATSLNNAKRLVIFRRRNGILHEPVSKKVTVFLAMRILMKQLHADILV